MQIKSENFDTPCGITRLILKKEIETSNEKVIIGYKSNHWEVPNTLDNLINKKLEKNEALKLDENINLILASQYKAVVGGVVMPSGYMIPDGYWVIIKDYIVKDYINGNFEIYINKKIQNNEVIKLEMKQDLLLSYQAQYARIGGATLPSGLIVPTGYWLIVDNYLIKDYNIEDDKSVSIENVYRNH